MVPENNAPNNFFAIRDRTGRKGFQFIVRDAEHTLLDVNENRNGPYPAGQNLPQFNPQFLHQQLMANANYRLKFADHVQKAFFNGGPLSPEAAEARFQSEAGRIRQAIIGESARWGDAMRPDAPLTQADWQAAVDRVVLSYMPARTAIVLDQFRANGLFPAAAAPIFRINGVAEDGGTVNQGDQLTLTAPSGNIYYTTDGTDPRLPNGAINPSAIAYVAGTPIVLSRTSLVTARTYDGAAWSALASAQFGINVPAAAGNLAVTEFNYHPAAPNLAKGELNVDREQFEFLELQNIGTREINLAGVKFTSGIAFNFTGAAITTLAPGAYVLIVKNPAAFASRYGNGLPVAGSYGGASGGLASLSNSSERLLLVDASGATIEDFTYNSVAPWPTSPDGSGPSLVRLDPTTSPNTALNWRASLAKGGSPGGPDTSPPTLSPIDDQTIAEDTPGNIAFTIGDTETPAASLVVTVAADNAVLLPPGSLVLTGNGADRSLGVTPAPNAYGNATITITVTDSDGAVARDTFLLTVSSVDDPPVGLPDSYATDEDQTLVVAAAAGLLGNDGDLEGDRLTSVPDQGPSHGTVIIRADGSFTYTPSPNYNGPDSFTYRPNDGTLDGAAVRVNLTVNPVPDAPVLAPVPNKVADEQAPLTFTVNATDPDLTGRSFTYRLDPGAPAGAAIDSKTGAFSWTPTEAQGPGVYPITVRATDPASPTLTTTTTFVVGVLEVNRLPVILDLPDRAVKEGATLSFRVAAVDPDAPAQSLTYALTADAPRGASIDRRTGQFSWTPEESSGPGLFPITVLVSDDGSPAAAAGKTFSVSVAEVNRPPVLLPIADAAIRGDETFRVVATAVDPDVPAQALTYSLDASTVAGATIDAATGAIRWTPSASQGPGFYLFSVRATDDGSPSLSATRSFIVTVTVPATPTIDLGPPIISVAGRDFSQAGSFVGAGPGPWTATVDYGDGSGAQPLAFSASHGFTIGHAYASPGVYSAVVRVRDASAVEGQGTVPITVNPAPLVTITSGSASAGPRGTTAIVLNFSDKLEAPNASTWTRIRLVTAGRDRIFGTRDDRAIGLAPAAYDPIRNLVTLRTRGRLPASIKTFRLSVPDGTLRDAFKRPLDGDRDGKPGGNFLALATRRTLTLS